MKKKITIILIAALLVAASVATSFAAAHHITRGEFFTELGKTLGLSEEETSAIAFPDYKSDNKIINAMINIKYVLGRIDGTLAAEDELSLEDMKFVFSRIKWPKEVVTKTEYVGGGTRYVNVPGETIYLNPSEMEHCEGHMDHLFALGADGYYKCVYKNCTTIAPAGTSGLLVLGPDSELPDEETIAEIMNEDATTFSLDKASVKLNQIIEDEPFAFQIASNAELFEMIDGEKQPIGFIDFFEKYSVNQDLGDTPDLTGWFHIQGSEEEIEEEYEYDGTEIIDLVIVKGVAE